MGLGLLRARRVLLRTETIRLTKAGKVCDASWLMGMTGQLFLEVFTSKGEMRRTTLVLWQLGHLMVLVFSSYRPNENINSKFKSHFRQ